METKKQDWCKRCEKLNVDHLGECPFKQEDWEAEFGKLFDDMQSADAPDVQTIIKDFIKPLLSTQEEMIRKEERERCAKIATKTIIKHRGTHPVWDTLKKEMLELLNNL